MKRHLGNVCHLGNVSLLGKLSHLGNVNNLVPASMALSQITRMSIILANFGLYMCVCIVIAHAIEGGVDPFTQTRCLLVSVFYRYIQ